MAEAIDGLIIWGCGGHGAVLADLVRATGNRLAGFVDRKSESLGREVEPGGGRLLMTEDAFRTAAADGRLPDGIRGVVLGIGDNRSRLSCLSVVRDQWLIALVHPSAVVSPSAQLGAGTVVLVSAIVNAEARLGRGVIINSGAIIEHECAVEDGAHISPGAVLGGAVRVGVRSWVGAGAVVIPGKVIGADAVVGAGAVVIRDVPDGATVAGNPARLVQRRG